jgi:hypothetical protein
LVWDGLNNAFDHWPIVVDDTCKYGVSEEVRIVKLFNPLRKILFGVLLILILYA